MSAWNAFLSAYRIIIRHSVPRCFNKPTIIFLDTKKVDRSSIIPSKVNCDIATILIIHSYDIIAFSPLSSNLLGFSLDIRILPAI